MCTGAYMYVYYGHNIRIKAIIKGHFLKKFVNSFFRTFLVNDVDLLYYNLDNAVL